ncbi:MAG: hypothetical protein IPM03_12575 [Sulfuritalea sp.]|nr:hypothetical protein [Sulfuritalea sp.]
MSRFTDEQIVAMLREADRSSVAEVARSRARGFPLALSDDAAGFIGGG